MFIYNKKYYIYKRLFREKRGKKNLSSKILNNSIKNKDYIINNYLFNLLADLIEQNNLNYTHKYANSFLIFAIINKILYNLGISGYIQIFTSENIIQIHKEKKNNRIGILEAKNNIIKLKKYIRTQNIKFDNIEKTIEIKPINHSLNIYIMLEILFEKLNLTIKFTKLFFPECIYSFSTNHLINSNLSNFIFEEEIKQDFDYYIFISNDYYFNENFNYGKVSSYKDKNNKKFFNIIEKKKNKSTLKEMEIFIDDILKKRKQK